MSINISELIWTVICFFVLLVVLKKLLFDPLVSFMAARDARIQDGISAGRTAQQQLDAAAQARSDAQRRQSAAADALLAEAKSASERKRAQTLQAAHQRAAATALAHHLLQLFRTKLDFALADVNGQRALRRQQEEVRQAIFAFRGLRRRDVDDLVALAF